MSLKDTLSNKILAITLKIYSEYPELSKYLNEMPATISTDTNPQVNQMALEEYYNSLKNLIKTYHKNIKQAKL